MNFYSYSPYGGMKYHATKIEAREAAEAALRSDPVSEIITWGEVTERAVDTGAGFVFKRQERLSYEATHPQVIDGRMEDAIGSLVLVKNIAEMELLQHDLVLSIATIWTNLSGKIQRFKQHNFEDVTTFVDLLYERHKAKRGGTHGNMTFTTVDRRWKLVIAIQKTIDFGPEIEVAKAKMLEAVKEMSADDSGDLETIVMDAYTQIDGKLRVAEILRLCRRKISNATWNEAVEIIKAAIEVISKKKQIRLYERNEVGAYIAIPLDIAGL